jgi:hypothetical protein
MKLIGALLLAAVVVMPIAASAQETTEPQTPAATTDAMSPLTAGPNGKLISQKSLAHSWWCRGMACVSRLPAEGDVCAELDPVNKGACHAQDKAHVLRAFDVRQGAEVILVLTSASLCSGQLRRWKRDANLQKPSCEVSTPGAFFGIEVSDKE